MGQVWLGELDCGTRNTCFYSFFLKRTESPREKKNDLQKTGRIVQKESAVAPPTRAGQPRKCEKWNRRKISVQKINQGARGGQKRSGTSPELESLRASRGAVVSIHFFFLKRTESPREKKMICRRPEESFKRKAP